MIMGGAREQIYSFSCKECHEAGVHVKQVKPHMPFLNGAKGAVGELKKGVIQQTVQSKAPK
jgi:hypothetical protein